MTRVEVELADAVSGRGAAHAATSSRWPDRRSTVAPRTTVRRHVGDAAPGRQVGPAGGRLDARRPRRRRSPAHRAPARPRRRGRTARQPPRVCAANAARALIRVHRVAVAHRGPHACPTGPAASPASPTRTPAPPRPRASGPDRVRRQRPRPTPSRCGVHAGRPAPQPVERRLHAGHHPELDQPGDHAPCPRSRRARCRCRPARSRSSPTTAAAAANPASTVVDGRVADGVEAALHAVPRAVDEMLGAPARR